MDSPIAPTRPASKTRLFPSTQYILHTLYFGALPIFFAVALGIDGRPLLALAMFAITLFTIRDLGFAVVSDRKVVSYRLSGRRVAETPSVLACDVDSIDRRVTRFNRVTYWYPALVLENGKTIKLPVARKSRDKTVKISQLMRDVLQIPVDGYKKIPKGRLARTLSGSKKTEPQSEPEFDSQKMLDEQWSYLNVD